MKVKRAGGDEVGLRLFRYDGDLSLFARQDHIHAFIALYSLASRCRLMKAKAKHRPQSWLILAVVR